MFKFDYCQDFEDIFEEGKSPKISNLSLITGSENWRHSYHIHEEETELLYIAEDNVDMTIDFREHCLRAGDLVIIEPGLVHSMKNNSGMLWSCVITDYQIKGMKPNTLLKQGISPVFPAEDSREMVDNIIGLLNRMKNGRNKGEIYACHSLTKILTAIYYEVFKYSAVREDKKPCLLVQSILNYLNDNFRRPLSLKELSEYFNVSPSYISHAFTREYQISPINYIIERRLTEARVLLINTDRTVCSIGETVGYSDINHFIEMFTKKTGLKPTDYRSQCRQKMPVGM